MFTQDGYRNDCLFLIQLPIIYDIKKPIISYFPLKTLGIKLAHTYNGM